MWMTYRKNFENVGETSLTSDKGWGCMVRTGQMLLTKALLIRHLGKPYFKVFTFTEKTRYLMCNNDLSVNTTGMDWHWEPNCRDIAYLKIVSLFADQSSAPFSLHQIAECGSTLGKPVGSWLGPNTVCQGEGVCVLNNFNRCINNFIFIF